MLLGETITAQDFDAFRQHFPRNSILVHTLASTETGNIAWGRWKYNDNVPAGVLPVGHFSTGTEVLLLGDDDQPVARGEVGQIVVRSRYLASGYWRDPELTAKRFSAELDSDGTRQVRTGDRGRISADGLLEYCGRNDDRLRMRGNRIEPLDIELALEGLPGVDRAAVVAVARDNHEPILVVFVVKTSNASWTAPRLRLALRANLPIHMVPSRILFLGSLPYNRSNKIDREALRQYPLPARDRNRGAAPRTETEILLADIWAETLELSDIGRDDDFFSLGGDSLIGAIVLAQVHAALGIELSLCAVADHPTVSTLAAFIDEARLGAAKTPPIVCVPRAAPMPMSLLQEAIWNLWQSRQDRAGLTHVRSYRISGPLDIEILKECLRDLVDRHEILRTTFDLVEGRPAQIIHQSGPPNLSFVDLIDVEDPEAQADLVFRQESSREVNLAKLPIRRHVLIRIANDNHRLLRVSHPMITDGLGSQILDAELAILYEATLHGKKSPLPKEAPLQYADYAVWQRQVMGPGGRSFDAGAFSAQPYPGRLIKLVLPLPAGSIVDVAARLLAPALSTRLGQPVIVENRPGGGGTVATKAVATAAPDGYTLLFVGVNHVFAPALSKMASADPVKDFSPIAAIITFPWVLVVPPTIPARSVKELVDYAKANPRKLNWGFGQATGPHLLGELFLAATGIDVTRIPYKGGTQAVPDMLGGRIQMNFGTVSNLVQLVQAGKLRALAVTGVARSPELPNVPTMTESGLLRLTLGSWTGLLAPANTPAGVVTRLNTEINAIMTTPEMKAGMAKLGFEPKLGSPQDFAAFIADQIDVWGIAARLAGIKPE